jgi:hypothetical protein
MKQTEIKEGLTYHNGKSGNRSYSARKVKRMVERIGFIAVDYEQIVGRFKGESVWIRLDSFAQWAKGVVNDET